MSECCLANILIFILRSINTSVKYSFKPPPLILRVKGSYLLNIKYKEESFPLPFPLILNFGIK